MLLVICTILFNIAETFDKINLFKLNGYFVDIGCYQKTNISWFWSIALVSILCAFYFFYTSILGNWNNKQYPIQQECVYKRDFQLVWYFSFIIYDFIHSATVHLKRLILENICAYIFKKIRRRSYLKCNWHLHIFAP